MHIEDWDESFLSQLDPKNYFEMLKLANVKSAMVYANSHVGYCYWPTKSGRMHRGIKGRDFLGEIIDLCHSEGIDVIVYYSLIFNNWAYEQHPEWRIIDLRGKTSREKAGQAGRYGVCCLNSPGYRKFVLDQIEELCLNYDFEGIFFDMTFWPAICYCKNCRRRYKEEEDEELPKIIDWNNPSWIRFQKKREEWLTEFAAMVTSMVKKYKPQVTVEHQLSTAAAPWTFGVSLSLVDQCDYVGGDFYGGVLQQSFICKLYYNITPNMPFEFMTSICYPNLLDHTTTKTEELIKNRAFLTIAHGGAFLVIDAIDPSGTLDERKYRMMGKIFKEVAKYEKYLGGELCQDVAIYFSFDSKMNFAESGKEALKEFIADSKLPHVEAALGATEALRTNHIPFGVISKKNLNQLSCYQAIVLPNVLRLSDEEADAIKDYVLAGGSLYLSGFTIKSKLSEMLGVNVIGETHEKFTYIAPTLEGSFLLPDVTEKYPLSIPDSQIKTELVSEDDVKVMATIILPYTDPLNSTKFASIHSNPPGVPTNYPALIYKKFGNGRVIWSSAPIEKYAISYLKHRSIFAHIIKLLVRNPLSFEAIAPECVEILMFHKPDEKRYLINIINFQSDIGIPNIPVDNITLKVKLEGSLLRAILLPDEKMIPFKQNKEYVLLKAPKLQTFHMLALDYK